MIKIGKLSTKKSLIIIVSVVLALLIVGTFIVAALVSKHASTSGKKTNSLLSALGVGSSKPSQTSATASPNPSSQTGNDAKPSPTNSPKTGSTSTSNSNNASTTSSSNTSSSNTSSSGSTPNPPPSGPLSTITITSFSATESPSSATKCNINQSVTFSTDGSGSVSVTWQVFSDHTSSAYDNPYVHTFSVASSQTDSLNSSWQGLEPGDSYRVRAILTSGSITQTAGPVTISSCAGPQPLLSPSQASYMSSPVTGTGLVVNQNADSIFTNSCSMNLQASFSVTGPGSVQAVYTITSASSIGATLYSASQQTFTGPGSATDSSYIRMPHLPSGSYSITVKLNVLGDPAHYSTYGPVTSACS